MRIIVLTIAVLTIVSCNPKVEILEVGKPAPDYTFHEVLNKDKKPFALVDHGKPIIIEFWATWCAPCLPVMKKMKGIQEQYGDKVEIITVSTDSKKNLKRYIENTQTTLRIAFDTSHLAVFDYKQIPQTVLIDKNGIVQGFTTPDQLTDNVIADFINGKTIHLEESTSTLGKDEKVLHKVFKSQDFQYQLTSEDKAKRFKNEIVRGANNQPISLAFNNVSIHRLFADIYELSSVARIYNREVMSSNRKFCFSLEQNGDYKRNLLENAKEILNNNLEVTAKMEEIATDSMYVLSVIDSTKLPSESTVDKQRIQFRGPSYIGNKIVTKDLAAYLENEAFQPVADKTGVDYAFDMELNWSYENPKTLNQELNKYGLQISRPDNPEKISILVLHKK